MTKQYCRFRFFIFKVSKPIKVLKLIILFDVKTCPKNANKRKRDNVLLFRFNLLFKFQKAPSRSKSVLFVN